MAISGERIAELKEQGFTVNPQGQLTRFDPPGGFSGKLVIPEGVVSVGAHAVGSVNVDGKHCKIVSVHMPHTVRQIGEGAFMNCTQLEVVAMSDAVESIGGQAFEACVSLGAITIPGKTKTIGAYAFRQCSSLVDAVIKDGVETIEVNAFRGCGSLIGVTLPAGMKTIRRFAFGGCSSLMLAVILGATEIHREAFDGCSSLGLIFCSAGQFEQAGLTETTSRFDTLQAMTLKTVALHMPKPKKGDATPYHDSRLGLGLTEKPRIVSFYDPRTFPKGMPAYAGLQKMIPGHGIEYYKHTVNTVMMVVMRLARLEVQAEQAKGSNEARAQSSVSKDAHSEAGWLPALPYELWSYILLLVFSASGSHASFPLLHKAICAPEESSAGQGDVQVVKGLGR